MTLIKKEDPKFNVGDHLRTSKYKNILAKVYIPNWSKEIFVIKKVNNTVVWTCVISDVKGEKVKGTFYNSKNSKKKKKKKKQ